MDDGPFLVRCWFTVSELNVGWLVLIGMELDAVCALGGAGQQVSD